MPRGVYLDIPGFHCYRMMPEADYAFLAASEAAQIYYWPFEMLSMH